MNPGRVIKGILAIQMAIGLFLVAGDLSAGWQGLSVSPRAPELDQPIRPGDQTRRYRPRDLPDRPGSPFPPTTDMPPRLNVTDVELNGRDVLRLVGTIAPGDADRLSADLADRLSSADPPGAVLLHSPGGSVDDALVLGRALRDAGARVEIAAGDLCLSACPYLLAGGATRRVDPDGTVGVHQHYFGQNSVQPAFLAVEDIQRGQGVVMAYLVEMGIDPAIMQHALVTPPDEIYVLVQDELSDYRMVTPDDTTGDPADG